MIAKEHLFTLAIGAAMGVGAVSALCGHRVLAQEHKMTNADYARDAYDNLKKSHEDITHLVNDAGDKKDKGYADAEEAKKATDRAMKALGRYLGEADAPAAAPAK
jgi:hypothetical protein